MLRADQADFTFSVRGDIPYQFEVYSWSGKEELNQMFEFKITLTSEDIDLDLDDLVGQSCMLTLRSTDGIRRIYGIIESIELLRTGRMRSFYVAQLIPTLGMLKYTRNSRVFPPMNVIGIIQTLLSKAGFQSDVITVSTSREYAARNFCVQYQESDLNFLMRLLEEEGIIFYFEHASGQDVMVLKDVARQFGALPLAPEIPFLEGVTLLPDGEEFITRYQRKVSIAPGKATLRDFRFKQPELSLEVSSNVNRHQDLEVYIYPGEYVEPELGQRLVETRLEELQAQQQRYIGLSNSKALMPGYLLGLSGHPRQDFQQAFLIVTVEHEGKQGQSLHEEQSPNAGAQSGYQAQFTTIPANVQYRPPRRTPRPVISGVQSAIVVGPSQEEIHCDEFGRVKVQFHWDRADKADATEHACWVRVSQPWGGASQGGIFIPRVGQEVLVLFLEGDPDRPVIVGRVYNGSHPVPHALPAHKNVTAIRTASTPGGMGFNELRFDDSAGREEVSLHAQKDLKVIVGSRKEEQVIGESNEKVSASKSTEVVGAYTENYGANVDSTTVGLTTEMKWGGFKETIIGFQTSEIIGVKKESVTGLSMESISGACFQTIQGGSLSTLEGGQVSSVVGGSLSSIRGGQIEVVEGCNTSITLGTESSVVLGAAQEVNVGLKTSLLLGGSVSVDVLNTQLTAVEVAAKGCTTAVTGVSIAANGMDMSANGIQLSANGISLETTAIKSESGMLSTGAFSLSLENVSLSLSLNVTVMVTATIHIYL